MALFPSFEKNLESLRSMSERPCRPTTSNKSQKLLRVCFLAEIVS